MSLITNRANYNNNNGDNMVLANAEAVVNVTTAAALSNVQRPVPELPAPLKADVDKLRSDMDSILWSFRNHPAKQWPFCQEKAVLQ